jgi:hypothetical protein
MTDKEFWLLIRRALLMVVRAIEMKYLSEVSTAVMKSPRV